MVGTSIFTAFVERLADASLRRYDWNLGFGFPEGSTQFHTSFATLNFLRVFRTNDGKGVECTWRMNSGLAEKALEELERDRAEGWSRWK